MSASRGGFGIYLSTQAYRTPKPVEELRFFGHCRHHSLRARDLPAAAAPHSCRATPAVRASAGEFLGSLSLG